MLCNKHPRVLSDARDTNVKVCSECGNMTYSDCQICAHCSKGFDECQRCRAPLQTGVAPRRLAVFRSPAAEAIRRQKLVAREDFQKKSNDARAIFGTVTSEYVSLVREQIAPHRLACELACKPFRDKVQAVQESLSPEMVAVDIIAMQKVHPRLVKALEECDAACLSIHDKYDSAVSGFISNYRKAVKPALAMWKKEVTAAKSEFDQQVKTLDRRLETLLYRSTRTEYIVLGAVIAAVCFIFCRRR